MTPSEYAAYLQKRSRIGKFYRNRCLYPKINRYLRAPILDVGCGIGDYLNYEPSAIGVDINPLNIEFCKSRNLHAILIEKDILPFQDATFQSVVLDNVIEHLSDPRALLSEIRRVLRSDGSFVVGIPGVRGYAVDQDHKKFYEENSLEKAIVPFGFFRSATFYAPLLKSRLLSQHFRIYCIYIVFRLIDVPPKP